MWYLFSHNKFFSVALICSILALIVSLFSATKIRTWSYEIQKMRDEKVGNERLVEGFEKQLQLYKGGFTEKVERIFTVRPGEDDLVGFLNSLDTAAARSDVRNFELKSVAAQQGGAEAARKSPYPVLGYSARFEATPQTFKKFMHEMDSLPYYVGMDRFSFHSKENFALSQLGDAELYFYVFTQSPGR